MVSHVGLIVNQLAASLAWGSCADAAERMGGEGALPGKGNQWGGGGGEVEKNGTRHLVR